MSYGLPSAYKEIYRYNLKLWMILSMESVTWEDAGGRLTLSVDSLLVTDTRLSHLAVGPMPIVPGHTWCALYKPSWSTVICVCIGCWGALNADQI